MNIKGLKKSEVLAALYNRARPMGMGYLHYTPDPMTVEEAQALFDAGQSSFDYLNGRVMKVDFDGDEVRTDLYNRDNGPGAAEEVIAGLISGS